MLENWSDNDAKKNKLHDSHDIFDLHICNVANDNNK